MEQIISPLGCHIATIIKSDFVNGGVNFFSKEGDPLQLGINIYKKNDKIIPHYHIKKELIISTIQEVVHLDLGRSIVTFYDVDNEEFGSRELKTGDTIIFFCGGHGFEILEDTRIVEVKQGPYLGRDRDKRMIGDL
jgi:sulfur relay (sulfurtransferase) DsrF/TusC family protein